MAPVKTSSAGSKDIRAFFSNSQSKSQSKNKVIEISDNDSSAPVASKHFKDTNNGKHPVQSTSKADDPMDVDEIKAGPSNSAQKRKKSAINVMLSSSDEDSEPPKKKVAATSKTKAPSPRKKRESLIISSDEDEEPVKIKKTKPRTSGVSAMNDKAKGKAPAVKGNTLAMKRKKKTDDTYLDGDDLSSPSDEDEDDEEEEEEKPKKKAKTAVRKKDAVKKEPAKVSSAPKPEKPTGKPNFAAIAARRAAGPAMPGSKDVPEGEPNCLMGLTFVFTGELTAFSRDEAVDLAKRYGGRVTGQPSSKTSYVVVGEDAGPSKLAALKKHNLATLDEDGFLDLIRTRKGFVDDKTREKMAKEEKKIRDAAKELEKLEKTTSGVPSTSQLWTVKYAPHSLKEICGNKGQVEKLQAWLHDWQNSLKASFKKPGKNGMNTFRAVMITGSPGIGKTTSAHLCAQLEGYTPIELNASDARSKKLVESGTNINNTSLDGWRSGGKATLAAGVEVTDKSVLIMDEVDGMSAGDRGGVGALNALIKKTKIPIICIANDRQAQKLKPLLQTTFNLSFRKPDANAVRSRIMSICFKEKMKIPSNVVDQLVQGAQSDIRQVINMLSTWRTSSDTMDFDQGKQLANMNEKYSIMSPFNVTNKILGPYAFSPTARETLSDKMELYFHDHSFVPLFIQENYLKFEPSRSKHMDGPEQIMKKLELMEKASSSLSDGDLVDAMIHSPEQHWSLMPLHAVVSTVRPASYMYGQCGYVGANAIGFPLWLGQNSKQNKLQRQLADVQIRMRLKVSGNKAEIRQSYIPAMHMSLVEPLIESGASMVDDVISTMDEYYLSKDEWDAILELGVGEQKDDKVLKKISAATKTNLTKKYNSMDHPIAFHKSADLDRVPRKVAAGPLPDLEEAFDLDEPEEEEKEDKKAKDPTGIAGDKLLNVGGRGKSRSKASVKSGAGSKKR